MGLKVISLLGTTRYTPVAYELQEGVGLPGLGRRAWRFRSTETPFFQVALWELRLKGEPQPWKMILFMTEKAQKANWEGERGLKTHLESLFSRERVGYRVEERVKAVPVPDEVMEAPDLWKLYELLFAELEEGDEVLLDITHSFRYVPVLALSVALYGRTLKKVTIREVVYGEHRPGDPLGRYMDLTPLVHMMDWAAGVQQLVDFGQVELLLHQLPALAAHTENEGERERLEELAQAAQRFHEDLVLCRARRLMESARALRESARRLSQEESRHLPPLQQLLAYLEESVQGRFQEYPQVFWDAASWCQRHGYIQQGYTFLLEGFREAARILADLPENRSQEVRQLLSMPPDSPRWNDPRYGKLKEIVLPLYEDFRDLRHYRNALNHAGQASHHRFHLNTTSALKEKLEKYLQRTRPFFAAATVKGR